MKYFFSLPTNALFLSLSILFPSLAFSGVGEDVKTFINKEGTFFISGKNNGNGVGKCSLGLDDTSLTLTYSDAFYWTGDAEFNISIELSAEKISEKNGKITYSSSGDAQMGPGSDKCGDAGGATNYKKTLVIDTLHNSISIKEAYRCWVVKKINTGYECRF